jgi:glycosyltransferase involved in cell wall biosynthesis
VIIVTPPDSPSPLIGRQRGVGSISVKAKSVGHAILHAFLQFGNERDAFVYVAQGGRLSTAPIYKYLQGATFDVAACVDRIGSAPKQPKQFDGIGRVSLETIVVRPTPGARRLLERWTERNMVAPDRDDVNLVVALAEVTGVLFSFLGSEWRWRPGDPGTKHEATVWFGATAKQSDGSRITELSQAKKPETPKPSKPRGPEVNWVGHLYQYTGYGKMNRELLFRVSNSVKARLDDSHKEPCYVDEDLRVRLDAYKQILVGPRAPLLRVMGPDWISGKERHRIVYTMQESSERVHPDMVKRANENFDELWTPTHWNACVFKDSGVRIPTRVIPLGVDASVYRPISGCKLPPCRLISDNPRRGCVAVPQGFTFLTIGLPGFRKGWDVIADAMELAFGRRKVGVNFVIGLTHSPGAWNEKIYKQFSRYKVPIWTLEGSFTEHELARIYNAVGCYVSASRGEGFNLPALEAAACGTPLVVPDNTAHTEVFGSYALTFKPDGVKRYPEGDWISDWYKGMVFSRFGKPSIRVLAEMLETARSETSLVGQLKSRMFGAIERRYTWDIVARKVVERLLEVQP